MDMNRRVIMEIAIVSRVSELRENKANTWTDVRMQIDHEYQTIMRIAKAEYDKP